MQRVGGIIFEMSTYVTLQMKLSSYQFFTAMFFLVNEMLVLLRIEQAIGEFSVLGTWMLDPIKKFALHIPCLICTSILFLVHKVLYFLELKKLMESILVLETWTLDPFDEFALSSSHILSAQRWFIRSKRFLYSSELSKQM